MRLRMQCRRNSNTRNEMQIPKLDKIVNKYGVVGLKTKGKNRKGF